MAAWSAARGERGRARTLLRLGVAAAVAAGIIAALNPGRSAAPPRAVAGAAVISSATVGQLSLTTGTGAPVDEPLVGFSLSVSSAKTVTGLGARPAPVSGSATATMPVDSVSAGELLAKTLESSTYNTATVTLANVSGYVAYRFSDVSVQAHLVQAQAGDHFVAIVLSFRGVESLTAPTTTTTTTTTTPSTTTTSTTTSTTVAPVALGTSPPSSSTTSSSTTSSSTTSSSSTTVPSSPTLRAVGSTDAPYAIAVGDSGTVLQYSGSWQAESSGVTSALYGVAFDGSGTDAIAVGAQGTVLSTTDDGTSWTAGSSGTTEDLYAISCPAASTCWAVGAGGTILYTADGSNWSTQTSGTTSALYGISCTSTTSCWAVGAGGTVLSTIDGSTWNLGTSGTTETLYGISCPALSDCLAVGAGGTILETTDGVTWSSQSSGTAQDLYAAAVWGYCGVATWGYCTYAAGAGGTLVDQVGTSWGPVASGTSADLHGLAGMLYFGQYAAVGTGETEVQGFASGAA